MAHIASCIRPDADRANVYITQETSARPPAAADSTTESIGPLDKSPSKYYMWPAPLSKSPVHFNRSNLYHSDRQSALSIGRSPTSLSDTALPPESLPFWQRGGSSLARRRKVSVPELGGTMTTVQEMSIDSPTIPGRPPLRKMSAEAFGHERSSSAPGTSWRAGPFGDALMSCVTGPSYMPADPSVSPKTLEPPTLHKLEPSLPLGKPLSPILSPSVNPKPTLKVDTNAPVQGLELPPEVPPKTPAPERRASPAPLPPSSQASRPPLTTPASATSGGITPLSALDIRRSPNAGGPFATPISALSSSLPTASPLGAFDRRASPRVERRDPFISHNRNISDTSIIDRGRPVRRSSKRNRSRTCSEANNPDASAQDSWKLPRGMKVTDAASRMGEVDKEVLHKQAYDQAEKFEILNKRDVASMSRELRAIDERCDYLRKTYKSLRAGRQKLHGRMIAYLKRGETVIFSRESLLKQEEALAELDISIDEFILKLEQAENRRLRLRQKLLEHVAAALVLHPSAGRADLTESTPPRSPVKAESPARTERKDVESIKIYADGHVLNLFSDIEEAIGKMGQMCEQTC